MASNNETNKPEDVVEEPVPGKRKSEREDRIEMAGEVVEAMAGALFRVAVGNSIVITTLAGKLRQNRIRILPGDRVRVEVSPYDLSRGRIVWRGN